MLGQFLVVVTFTNRQPPTQARQKRPGSREETVFAVRHGQLFNKSNQREAVCLQDMRWSMQRRARIEAGAAADGAMRGRGKSSWLSTRRQNFATIGALGLWRPGLVPFATLLPQPWFPICKITHLKHSTDTWRFGSGAVHLFDGLSSSSPSDSRHHSLPPTMEPPPQPPAPLSLTKITTEDSPIFICLIFSNSRSHLDSAILHAPSASDKNLSQPVCSHPALSALFPAPHSSSHRSCTTGDLAWARQIVVNLWKPSAPSLASVSQNPRRLPLGILLWPLRTPADVSLSLDGVGQPDLDEAVRHARSVNPQRRNGNQDFQGSITRITMSSRIEHAVWQDHYGARGSAAWSSDWRDGWRSGIYSSGLSAEPTGPLESSSFLP